MPSPASVTIKPLTPFKPDLYERAWCSTPHPTLPLIATAHAKSVTIFSLSTLSSHSKLAGGHQRSVRCVAWKPGLPPHKLCLVTGSFDATAGLWRWDGDVPLQASDEPGDGDGEEPLEREIRARGSDSSDADDKEWEFTLVLEGHDSEIKSASFAPSGVYLATCSRDKSVWIWEDVGATEADDEWETVAVLNEHDGDVKAVAWCPDVPGRNSRRRYSTDVLASASYDNTVRIWREDGDGEWVCVAVLEGHEGTVWGVEWEPAPKDDKFPRLMTFSADRTIRLWTLQEEKEDEEGESAGGFRGTLGGIPNTMRRSLREDWTCTAVLPQVHTRDIYSVTWSATTGLLASTGSDSMLAVYGEDDTLALEAASGAQDDADAAMELDGEPALVNGHTPTLPEDTAEPAKWHLLASLPTAHGPYEVNHVTWCKRFDPGSERKGVEEMLVTSGDDGLIRTWEVIVNS